MAARVNPAWIKTAKEKIDLWRSLEGGNNPLVFTVDYLPAAKWVIVHLTELNIPFKLIELGAGVKQITTQVDTCPKCHGTGKC